MKKSVLIALVSVVAIGAQAALLTNVGATAPSANVLTGYDTVDAFQQVVKNVDGSGEIKDVVMGQVFSLAGIAASEQYELSDLYLKSYTAKDSSLMTGNLEVKIFSGTSGSPLNSSLVYDLPTSAITAEKGDWIKMDLGGLTLDAGGQFSFLIFMTSADADNEWGFYKSKGDEYPGTGNHGLYGAIVDYTPTWNSSDPWTGTSARADDQDHAFYLSGSVIPEPATLGMVAMVGTGLLFVRRRLML